MDNKQLRTLYAEFCRDMLEWIQGGKNYAHPHSFSERVGLCSNLLDWGDLEHIAALCEYQKNLFRDAGLDTVWPFDGTREVYRDSNHGAGLYTNEARLQWLRDHAEL